MNVVAYNAGQTTGVINVHSIRTVGVQTHNRAIQRAYNEA